MDTTTNETTAMDGEVRDDLGHHDPEEPTVSSPWAVWLRRSEVRPHHEQWRGPSSCDRLSSGGACGGPSVW
jgi:hypothetical protein